jgi:hypothetical protein
VVIDLGDGRSLQMGGCSDDAANALTQPFRRCPGDTASGANGKASGNGRTGVARER